MHTDRLHHFSAKRPRSVILMKTVQCLWFVVLGIVPSIRAATCPAINGTQTYPFTATFPSGCQQSACTFYLGVKTNANDPNYLDFWMEGSAAGYVAVGFSSTGRMDSSDVIMCGVDSTVTGGVGIVDAYNVGYNSVRDSTQNVCPHSVSFSNGRIVCSFSRLINTGDTTQDKVLSASYYLLLAATASKPAGSGSTLAPSLHDFIPAVTAQLVNLVSFLSSSCPSSASTTPYRLTATIPNGCQQSACTFFLGIRTNTINPQYLDFWMEGNAQGYIAVGFSPNGRMDNSDVLMCGVDSSVVDGGVGVVDAYNQGYSSARDIVQNVCSPTYSVSVTNGRIQCSFSRPINTGDTTQDKNLNISYYLLLLAVDRAPLGSGNTLAPSQHDMQPTVSKLLYNVAQDTGSSVSSDTVPKTALTKAHGILMLIAWPLLGLTGIFFAAWMKPALGPPPMPPKWFTIHRILMLASMFVGAAGFVIIFIANYGINKGLIPLSSNESLAHVGIGIIVMLLHIINPIISAFRCLPTSPRRWIFNIIHGSLIGFAVEILALINCGIGLALFEANGYSSSPGTYRSLGIYVTYVTLLFLLFVFLFALFTGVAIITGGEMGLKLGPALIKPFLEYFIGNKKQEPMLFNNAVAEVPGISSGADARLRVKALDSPAPAPAPAPVVTTPPAPPVATKPPKSKDVVLRWIGLTMFLCITVLFILIIIVLVAS